MELSPARQKMLFVVIVAVLALLGYFVVLPGLKHNNVASGVIATSSPSQPQAPAVSAAPVVTESPSGPVNIYSWLPFTEADLADAAAVATQFCVDYETYTYTESATAYVGAMGDLVTGQLAGTLRAVYQTPGVAKLRTSQKQVSTGTAVINSLRAFGPSSMTFVVTAGQRLATSNGTSNASTQYAVTVTGSGSSWQVSDIELESAGNS